jgi:hypothetical protein
MAKVSLTVDKNYASDWKTYAGVREILANAKDADDDGYKMTVEHFPRTSRLEITTADIYVDPAKLFILGKTDKVGDRHRGRYGEGFCVGVLALMRQGLDVSFRNGDLSWTVSFEEPDGDHPLAGNQLMTFRSRKLAAREADFIVTVENLPTEAWDVLKKMFLFIEVPRAVDTLQLDGGRLLLAPDRRGHVFSRGVFVREFEDLACGYDLSDLPLDRDRRFVNEFDLHWKLAAMWREACKRAPDLAAPRVYDMAKANTPEAKAFKWHADEKLLKTVRERYEAEHGTDAVPVATMREAKEIEGAGGKPTVVSEVLRDLLERGGLSAEGAKKKLEGQIDARLAPGDLTITERIVVDRLMGVVHDFAVVVFRGEQAACRLIDGDATVGVDRRLLSGPYRGLLQQVVAAEARRRKVEPVDVLLAHLAGEGVPSESGEEA